MQSNVINAVSHKTVRISKLERFSEILERIMSLFFTFCGFTAVAFVILITVFLIISGTPAIAEIGPADFLLGTKWASTSSEPLYGILPFILASIYGMAGAVILGVPVSILCSVFIVKKAGKILSPIVSSVVNLMSGIPSVVYGLVGMMVVVPSVRNIFSLPDGANLLSAVIVLAVMIIPSVISVSETAIRAVPPEYEEASLALGANMTETIFKVTLPAARSGILASVVLGTGRAIGEAMAVMMVSGNVPNMPGIFKSVRFLTTAVASEMSYSSGLQREALFSVALVLFCFIMMINIILNLVVKREKK